MVSTELVSPELPKYGIPQLPSLLDKATAESTLNQSNPDYRGSLNTFAVGAWSMITKEQALAMVHPSMQEEVAAHLMRTGHIGPRGQVSEAGYMFCKYCARAFQRPLALALHNLARNQLGAPAGDETEEMHGALEGLKLLRGASILEVYSDNLDEVAADLILADETARNYGPSHPPPKSEEVIQALQYQTNHSPRGQTVKQLLSSQYRKSAKRARRQFPRAFGALFGLDIRFTRFVKMTSILGCGVVPYHLNAQTSSVNAQIMLPGSCPVCGKPVGRPVPLLTRLWICVLGIPIVPLGIHALFGCQGCGGGFIRLLTKEERRDLIHRVNSWDYNNLGSHGSYWRLWVFIIVAAVFGSGIGEVVCGHAVAGAIVGWGIGAVLAVRFQQGVNRDHPSRLR